MQFNIFNERPCSEFRLLEYWLKDKDFSERLNVFCFQNVCDLNKKLMYVPHNIQ